MVKIASKDLGTQEGYKVALNNLENFCMEKYGKADFISQLKEYDMKKSLIFFKNGSIGIKTDLPEL